MKNKILYIFICLLLLTNSAASIYLWMQNKELSSHVSGLQNELYRLDIDALEKIKSKPEEFNSQEGCGSGMWQLPCE